MLEVAGEAGTARIFQATSETCLFTDNPRDYALFIMGINTNLRASDLVNITVKQVRDLKPVEDLVLTEQKTGKERRITLNAACVDAVDIQLGSQALDDDDPVFKSRKGGKLCVQSVHRLVKSWCKLINLSGNYGSHSLRKTWGYHQRVTFGADLPTLMTCTAPNAKHWGVSMCPAR